MILCIHPSDSPIFRGSYLPSDFNSPTDLKRVVNGMMTSKLLYTASETGSLFFFNESLHFITLAHKIEVIEHILNKYRFHHIFICKTYRKKVQYSISKETLISFNKSNNLFTSYPLTLSTDTGKCF